MRIIYLIQQIMRTAPLKVLILFYPSQRDRVWVRLVGEKHLKLVVWSSDLRPRGVQIVLIYALKVHEHWCVQCNPLD